MGFVATGNTVSVVAYLTQTGRQLLFQGDKSLFKVAYFTLGDSDANYLIVNPLGYGSVPDITGNQDDCVPSISLNIDIKNKINNQ